MTVRRLIMSVLLLSHLGLPAFAAPSVSSVVADKADGVVTVANEKQLPTLNEAIQQLPEEMQIQLFELSEQLEPLNHSLHQEMQDEAEVAIPDLALLWQAAVQRSRTIRYAISKLSRQDAAGESIDNDPYKKKVIQNIAQLGGVAGTLWSGSPIGLLSGSLMSEVLREDGRGPRRVSDADMVILAQAVERLQRQVIQQYYDYRYSQVRYQQAQAATSAMRKSMDSFYDRNESELVELMEPLLSSLMQTIEQREAEAKRTFQRSENALALLVGPDSIEHLSEKKTG